MLLHKNRGEHIQRYHGVSLTVVQAVQRQLCVAAPSW